VHIAGAPGPAEIGGGVFGGGARPCLPGEAQRQQARYRGRQWHRASKELSFVVRDRPSFARTWRSLHGIGDEKDAAGTLHPEDELDHPRIEVVGVGYDLHVDIGVHEGKTGYARFAMVDTAHGVEDMGDTPGARLQSRLGLTPGGVGMAHADDDSHIRHVPDEPGRAVKLGGDGDDPHDVLEPLHEFPPRLRGHREKGSPVEGTRLSRVEKRPFEMNARDPRHRRDARTFSFFALHLHGRPDGRDVTAHLIDGCRKDRGQDRFHARRTLKPCHREDVPRARPACSISAEAMGMKINHFHLRAPFRRNLSDGHKRDQ